MISNLKVTDKLIKLAKKHPKISLLGTLAFITAVIVTLTLGGGHKKESEMGDSRPPVVIEEQVDSSIVSQTAPPVTYSVFDVSIVPGTTLTLEPGGGSYVGKVRVSTQARLVLIDGDYALVLYNVPQEKYNYDLSHDHRRLGYVPLNCVMPLADHMADTAAPDERYICFDNSTRVRIDKDEEGGILTTAKKGDYARVVGLSYGPEWSDDDWIIVAYGDFIGYVPKDSGTIISREAMLDIINNSRQYIRITGKGINLRSSPNKEKKNVKEHLNNGDEALVLEHSNGWYHVIFNGIEGYISDELMPSCIEEFSIKKVPDGLENLHFENSDKKTI